MAGLDDAGERPALGAIDLMRRVTGDLVEFPTIMWFDDLDAIRAFVRDDAAQVSTRRECCLPSN